MQKKSVLLMYAAAVFGNLLFVLWIFYNAIYAGVSGSWPEIISCVVLICLLALNSYLILTSLDRENMITDKSN
ncbi:hypothetical protein [Mucilaginibacter sp. L3T2-6]|uniref:hypothetical protein n=1 Tax=Mucilaginibacter sp. L3T2-6 TaxID=3062491 RepID=UPI002676E5D1|nr:hypothetical protein [Mucilaginibacter sp. L3T2-6]MDO3641600.1 hypothetical protein [Mucilaginibacter sp. L3T2-6]MDV6214094.1 hypothetical protein [Mucilaginibacter sp. L3T2-6]